MNELEERRVWLLEACDALMEHLEDDIEFHQQMILQQQEKGEG
jgi:hypothetical protein